MTYDDPDFEQLQILIALVKPPDTIRPSAAEADRCFEALARIWGRLKKIDRTMKAHREVAVAAIAGTEKQLHDTEAKIDELRAEIERLRAELNE